MKILFVFTGGTIGATETHGVRSADPGKPYKIISAYRDKFGIDFEYDTAEPYSELSENNTGLHIKALVECIGERLSAGYDGVVVTHGTDTIQYSAAAIGYAFGLKTPPICLVSSNSPIEDAGSNALINLRAAILFIKLRAGEGVFSLYSNDGETVKVHRGTRLVGSRSYSDAASSIFRCAYGSFDKSFTYTPSKEYSEGEDQIAPISIAALPEDNAATMIIAPYPGMIYPEIPERVKYIILNTYHSGTFNSKSEASVSFFKNAMKRGVTVFATGIESGISYSSMSCFEELGIIPLKNTSPIAVYMKLWMADSAGIDPKSVIDRSLSGDIA